MTVVNVPRFMNSLLAEMQAEATERGVRLVGDVSTEMSLEIEAQLLHGCLVQVIGTFIRSMRSGSSMSLLTAYQPPKEPHQTTPCLHIEIAGPALTNTAELDCRNPRAACNVGAYLH